MFDTTTLSTGRWKLALESDGLDLDFEYIMGMHDDPKRFPKQHDIVCGMTKVRYAAKKFQDVEDKELCLRVSCLCQKSPTIVIASVDKEPEMSVFGFCGDPNCFDKVITRVRADAEKRSHQNSGVI